MEDMLGHTLSDGHRLRKLGPKELVTVRRAFNEIDTDGSGQIDIIEVRAAILSIKCGFIYLCCATNSPTRTLPRFEA